jgi:hypothetical protein
LAKRDFAEAERLVSRVREYDPGHVGLPDAQAALTQAADRERARADRALKRGHLEEAGDGYRGGGAGCRRFGRARRPDPARPRR